MNPPQRPRPAFAVLRKPIQFLVVVLGWMGFVWLWVLVAARPWESQRLLWLIVGSFIVLPLLTGAWVMHNRALFKRKGERRAVAVAEMRYTHDWHGREVQADWSRLKRSRLVHISADGARKVYRPAMPDADDAGHVAARVPQDRPPHEALHAAAPAARST